MIQFVHSLLGMTSEREPSGIDDAPPQQSEVPAHDPSSAMATEQVRQVEQWLDHVAATNAAQQAHEAAVTHDPHHT